MSTARFNAAANAAALEATYGRPLTSGYLGECLSPRSRRLQSRQSELSSQAVRHNRTSEDKIHSVDQLGSAGGATLRENSFGAHRSDGASQSLESLYTEIEELGEATDTVRKRQSAFLAATALIGEENENRYRKNFRKSIGGTPAQRKTLVRGSKLLPHEQPKFAADDDDLTALGGGEGNAENAEEAEHGEKIAIPLVCSVTNQPFSRQQLAAICKFGQLDTGRADSQEVFDIVTDNRRRVMTKIEFYRDRSDFVLPRINEQFMIEDPVSGGQVLNVERLRRRAPPKIQEAPKQFGSQTARSFTSESFDWQLDSPPHSARASRQRPSALQSLRRPMTHDAKRPMTHDSRRPMTHDSMTTMAASTISTDVFASASSGDADPPKTGLSHVSSVQTFKTLSPSSSMESLHQKAQRYAEMGFVPLKTLSPSSSMESLHQKAERYAEMGFVRDFRIACARETEREESQARRHAAFDKLHEKACRREIADRERRVFTWMLLGIVTKTMVKTWISYSAAYKEVHATLESQEWAIPLRGSRDTSYMPGTEERVWSIVLHSRLPAFSRDMTLKALHASWAYEVKEVCKRHRWKNWRKLLGLLYFIGRLKKKIILNNFAEAIKDFINASWRGYTIRSSIKYYLLQVSQLQNAMRACVKMRDHIRNKILMPMVWDIETAILGRSIGMPRQALESELHYHRSCWNLEKQKHIARKLSHARYKWSSMSKAPPVKIQVGEKASEGKTLARKLLAPLASTKNGSSRPKTSPRHQAGRRTSTSMLKESKEQIQQKEPKEQKEHKEKEQKVPHPMMAVIDQYRISKASREKLVHDILKENIDRWYKKYVEYKEHLVDFQRSWQRWRVEIQALGQANRSIWPTVPVFPMYPHELTKVDQKVLYARVLNQLKKTEAGQLL